MSSTERLAHNRVITTVATLGAFLAVQGALHSSPALGQDAAPITAAAPPPDESCPAGYVADKVQADGTTDWRCSTDPVDGAGSTPSAPSATEAPKPSDNGSKKPHKTTPKRKKHFNLNMHDWGPVLSDHGCGILALSTAISYERQQFTNPHMVWKRSHSGFSADGKILANEYMRLAAPDAAEHYGLRARQIELKDAVKAIKHGGAVIMLATGFKGSIITGASHYFEADETKNGKVYIHDPNQREGREFNNSWRSIKWLRANKTLNDAWVIEQK